MHLPDEILKSCPCVASNPPFYIHKVGHVDSHDMELWCYWVAVGWRFTAAIGYLAGALRLPYESWFVDGLEALQLVFPMKKQVCRWLLTSAPQAIAFCLH